MGLGNVKVYHKHNNNLWKSHSVSNTRLKPVHAIAEQGRGAILFSESLEKL